MASAGCFPKAWFDSTDLKEIRLEMHDNDHSRFKAEGGARLPIANDQGYVENE